MPRMLTYEEELALARRWRDSQDYSARDELVLAHLPLSNSIASRVKAHGIPLADILQQGVLGLLKTAENFDPEKGFRFATLARWWIRCMIDEYILRNAKTVRPSTGTGAKRKERIDEIRVVSLHMPIRAAEDGYVELGATIPDTAKRPDELIEEHNPRLAPALAQLEPREREIVQGRFGHEETLQVVGDRLGLSKERVRQLESKALQKLRKLMSTREVHA